MISPENSFIPTSYLFPCLNIFTLLLTYAKNESDLYLKWPLIFIPTFLYLTIEILIALKKLLFLEINEDLNVKAIEIKLTLMNNLAKIIMFTISLFFIYFLSEYFDFLDFPPKEISSQDYSTTHLYILVFLFFVVYLIYSVMISSLAPKENTWDNNEKINIVSILMNSLFSILGNTMTICSTGACTSIYVSTISTFFSAFGITIVDWLPYLKYSALIFILISIFSLYSARKSLIYMPFIVCVIGSTLIILSIFQFDNNYMLYSGNILMIIAAIWNARLNKAGFGKKKKAVV